MNEEATRRPQADHGSHFLMLARDVYRQVLRQRNPWQIGQQSLKLLDGWMDAKLTGQIGQINTPSHLHTTVRKGNTRHHTCRFGPYPSRALALLGRATAFTLKPRCACLQGANGKALVSVPILICLKSGSYELEQCTQDCCGWVELEIFFNNKVGMRSTLRQGSSKQEEKQTDLTQAARFTSVA
eukprot:1159395-Pelagomonas_calceolata.AAC.5